MIEEIKKARQDTPFGLSTLRTSILSHVVPDSLIAPHRGAWLLVATQRPPVHLRQWLSATWEALHELQQAGVFHGIENVYDLPGKMLVLWAYGAGQVGGGIDGLPDGWLRCVVPDTGKNRSRWPVHPVWAVIQGAFQGACEMPERFGEVVRKRHYDHNIRQGVEAMVGYATSLASWVGGDLADPDADFTVFLHWLAIYGQKYLTEKDLSFGAEVQRKLLAYGHSEELAE